MGRPRTKSRLPERLQRKGGRYYYTPYIDGKLKWIALGADYGAAVRQWAEKEQAGAPTGKSFDDLEREFALRVVPTWEESTQALYPYWAQALRDTFTGIEVSAIKPMHIYGHIEKRAKESARSSGLRERSVLSSMLTTAVEWGWIEVNPAASVRVKNGDKVRTRYVKDDEFAPVYQEANDTVQICMDIGYMTGWRIGDIIRLPRDADADGEYLWRTQRKNKVSAKYPLTPQLRAVLARAKLKGGSKARTMVAKRNGEPYTYSGIRSMFDRACAKAKVENFQFRDVRSKAVTDAKEQGRDHQAFSRHKDRATADRYVKEREVPTVEPMVITSKMRGK